MFQSVSQGRANPKVTLQDFKHISCAAFLPYFGGGIDQYAPGTGSHKRPAGVMVLHYIKGVGLNRAKIVWTVFQDYADAPPNRKATAATSGTPCPHHSLIHYNGISIGTIYDSDKILPNLKIKENEVRMVVDVNLAAFFCNGMYGRKNVPASFWGMLIIAPKMQSWYPDRMGGQFHHFAIFTPKPGLFDGTPPA